MLETFVGMFLFLNFKTPFEQKDFRFWQLFSCLRYQEGKDFGSFDGWNAQCCLNWKTRNFKFKVRLRVTKGDANFVQNSKVTL